jgi:hypothetical protein
MERRAFLMGGAAAAAALVAEPALAQSPPAGQPIAPSDLESTVARLRKQFLAEFDPAYVENVIVPHFLVSTYDGERLWLPMINVEFIKENALPYDLWGMLKRCGSGIEFHKLDIANPEPLPTGPTTVIGDMSASAGMPSSAKPHRFSTQPKRRNANDDLSRDTAHRPCRNCLHRRLSHGNRQETMRRGLPQVLQPVGA